MYDYIARYYGIRPRYGERVRLSDGMEGTVKRERSNGHRVVILPDDRRHVVYEHPKAIEYLDREGDHE